MGSNTSLPAFEEKIFSIRSAEEFNSIALEVFHFQRANNSVYGTFVNSLRRSEPKCFEEIPFLPISFFKTADIIASGFDAELTFLSSGTTGMTRSRHLIAQPEMYRRSFESTYRRFIGDPKDQVILALLPNYEEQGNSSLIFMVDHLIKMTGHPLSGFLLKDLKAVKRSYDVATRTGKKVIIFGVSYALLDLAEVGTDLSQALIIETGGMKGRRKELTKEELHQELIKGLEVPFVSSEYGMTELLSQAYSDKEGLFTCPNWMKILCRDVNDPFHYVTEGKTGGINVIDLANLYSCSFIATQDLGRLEGNAFRIMGRFDNADLRGCNLMVE
jgi:hypothetical protein